MKGLLEAQPRRMAREKRLLDELAAKEKWFSIGGWGSTEGGNLCVHFGLQLPYGILEGTLVYPPQFPDVPAYVYPRDRKTRWSGHQYGKGGVLCLERGPDNWDAAVTGADLVQSANRLLWGEFIDKVLPGKLPIPSRHASTRGQTLRFANRRFVVSPGFQALLSALEADTITPLTSYTTFLGEVTVSFVRSMGEPSWLVPDVPAFPVLDVLERPGWVVKVDARAITQSVTTAHQLQELLAERWPMTEEPSAAGCLVLLHHERSHLRVFRISGGNAPAFDELAVIEAPVQDEPRHPAAFSNLTGKTVMLVGAGSLGSKVALSLVRAGVDKFCLVDEDVLMPENLVRHALTWRAVGFDKVHGVANDIRMVAPGASVGAMTFSIGGQENPSTAASFSELVFGCDLVIDCTASAAAFVALAAACKHAEKPMIWAELFGGGIGGLLARSRPVLDADPLSIRSHIAGVLSTLAPVPEEMRSRRVNYELGEEDSVLVASDADVSVMAGHLAQFALDALCAEQSEYPMSAYLIGFKKAWEFRQPFDTIPIDCSGAHRTEVPGPPLTSKEEKDVAELLAAFQAGSHASSHGPG